MKPLSVTMIRENLDNLPRTELPNGFRIRTFKRGDESLWADIETSAGEFERSTEFALERFGEEFASDLPGMESRCLFLETEDGLGVGTGTAWYNNDFMGRDYGRIHWVGIRPEFHNKGLGKALVAALLHRLAESHDRAYLKTLTDRIPAIKIYLDFGFVPLFVSPECPKAWKIVAEALPYPGLVILQDGQD